jgi:hypothetical protein
MGKLSFIAGLAAGYVLGARAGRQRYEQIRRTSEKVWNSGAVQKQVGNAKEAARTKAAPVVADLVADAARATGEKLRQGRTIASETVSGSGEATDHTDAWGAATRPTSPDEPDAPARPAQSGTPAASTTSDEGSESTDHTDAWGAATRPTSSTD